MAFELKLQQSMHISLKTSIPFLTCFNARNSYDFPKVLGLFKNGSMYYLCKVKLQCVFTFFLFLFRTFALYLYVLEIIQTQAVEKDTIETQMEKQSRKI